MQGTDKDKTSHANQQTKAFSKICETELAHRNKQTKLNLIVDRVGEGFQQLQLNNEYMMLNADSGQF